MIEVQNLKKTFHLKSGDVVALDGVSFSIEDGTVYGVIGYSGAGKSSLVRCMNLLEIPDEGTITIGDYHGIEVRNGIPYYQGRPMTARQQNQMRRGIGMIFQHFNLLKSKNVFENIDETLYGIPKFEKPIDKINWVCDNFEGTQKVLENKDGKQEKKQGFIEE